MRFIYTLRVFFISFEALVLAGACWIWLAFATEFQRFAASLVLDPEVLKYLGLASLGIAVWIINECRSLLQEDAESARLLTKWEDYWRLKVHFWVAIIYAVIFALLAILSVIAKSWLLSGGGLFCLMFSLLGILVVAFSVYAARIQVKEILVHATAPTIHSSGK